MENEVYFQKIAVLSKDERLTEGVLLRLQNHTDSSFILLANHELKVQFGIDKSPLSMEDITLLDQQLSSVEVVIYIDNLLHPINDESSMVKNLNELTNLVNVCIENQVKKLIYVSPFTPAFGSHYNTHIDENTIWESSMNLDVNSKYIHLALHEVNRGINEGLSCSILSCGHLVENNANKSRKNLIESLLKTEAPSFQFVNIDDVFELIKLTLISQSAPNKMLLIGNTKTYAEMAELILFKPTILKRIVQFFKSKSKESNSINIDNKMTLDFYKKSFRTIDLKSNL